MKRFLVTAGSYISERPLFSVLMSRGNDFDALAKNISDLSALVYKKI